MSGVLSTLRIGAIAIVLALLGSLIVAPVNAQDRVAAPAYKLGSGDQLRVTVFGHKDLSGEFQIDGQGNISLPLVGKIRAGNMTTRQLETSIARRLRPDYLKNPRVSVDVLNYRPFYIVGEVKKPGSYAYVAGMKIINAVALAGGFTYRARTEDLLIKRAKDPKATWQKASPETVVLPGDVVKVKERWF